MFISFINTASPDDLCALSGLCWDSLLARTTAVRAAVSPVPALAPALRAVGQARLVAQSRAVGIQVGNACDTCRMAVIQAHMLIASPDVQVTLCDGDTLYGCVALCCVLVCWYESAAGWNA